MGEQLMQVAAAVAERRGMLRQDKEHLVVEVCSQDWVDVSQGVRSVHELFPPTPGPPAPWSTPLGGKALAAADAAELHFQELMDARIAAAEAARAVGDSLRDSPQNSLRCQPRARVGQAHVEMRRSRESASLGAPCPGH